MFFPMRTLAPCVLGFLLLLAGTIGCFMLAGNPPAILFYFVPSLAMLLIPIGCSTIAFGMRGPLGLVRSLTVLWGSEQSNRSEVRQILSAYIGYVYGAGAFVFLASLLSIMACLSEAAAFGLTEQLGRNVAATIVSLMYPVVLAELLLRPLKHRLA